MMQPILDQTEAEKLCYQIDLDSSQEPGLGYVNGANEEGPVIAGSFTGWRFKKMRPLHEWTSLLDAADAESTFDLAKRKRLIRQHAFDVDDLTERERFTLEMVE